ncbi:1-phosphofructokinase family hexose kinase [Agromyces sp. LHK192]|uniref:1-phosphofructokinase family hexose kinase n=1 Tax=Agromyces sp. LHK192 TaxID=2498704 RepID=UPI000FDACC5D|nr:hexose kinase [Agromyces sp. LHK192]
MILTVTPNPALDLTWHTAALDPGATHRVERGVARAGGKGVNVARVLHGAGRDVLALTTRGGATGDEFAEELRRSGIPHRLLDVAGPTRRSVAVVDRRDGEATVLNEFGSPLDAVERDELLAAARRHGADAEVVAVSGSLPPGVSPDDVAALVADLTAAGVPVVADVAGPALLAAARAGAAAVKPNREELLVATGETDPLRAARGLVELGARLVVASLGSEGLIAVSDGGAVSARLGRTLQGNATGAGDAAVAAICTAIADRRSGALPAGQAALASLASRAAAWSASAVLMPLAGDLHPDHLALEREIILEPR